MNKQANAITYVECHSYICSDIDINYGGSDGPSGSSKPQAPEAPEVNGPRRSKRIADAPKKTPSGGDLQPGQ